jgi:hypothetical protein
MRPLRGTIVDMNDNVIEENKDIVPFISKTLNSCDYCIQILNEICSNMPPYKAQGFCTCVQEIEQNDGHELCERFLRLYRCVFLNAREGKPEDV